MSIDLPRKDLGSTREQIDAMIAGAVASLDRGEGVDGEDFFGELEREERPLQEWWDRRSFFVVCQPVATL